MGSNETESSGEMSGPSKSLPLAAGEAEHSPSDDTLAETLERSDDNHIHPAGNELSDTAIEPPADPAPHLEGDERLPETLPATPKAALPADAMDVAEPDPVEQSGSPATQEISDSLFRNDWQPPDGFMYINVEAWAESNDIAEFTLQPNIAADDMSEADKEKLLEEFPEVAGGPSFEITASHLKELLKVLAFALKASDRRDDVIELLVTPTKLLGRANGGRAFSTMTLPLFRGASGVTEDAELKVRVHFQALHQASRAVEDVARFTILDDKRLAFTSRRFKREIVLRSPQLPILTEDPLDAPTETIPASMLRQALNYVDQGAHSLDYIPVSNIITVTGGLMQWNDTFQLLHVEVPALQRARTFSVKAAAPLVDLFRDRDCQLTLSETEEFHCIEWDTIRIGVAKKTAMPASSDPHHICQRFQSLLAADAPHRETIFFERTQLHHALSAMRKLADQASSNEHSSARVRLQIPTGFKAINCRLSAEPARGKKLTTTVAAQHRDTGDNSIDWLIAIDALLFMAQMETASNVELHFSPSHPMVMSETDLRDLSSIHRGEGIKACIFRVLEPPSPRKRKSKISQASQEVINDA